MSAETLILSVMSFNTWNSGNNVYEGLKKIAHHINANNPDVVGLQEMYDDKINTLLSLLQNRYHKCSKRTGATYIITRLPIIEEYVPSNELSNTGCKIQISADCPVTVNVWDVHLHWSTYGPYEARDKNPTDANRSILLYCECKNDDPASSRVHNLKHVFNHEPFRRSLNDAASGACPLILLGDFNCPSHLDWTEECRPFHNDWSFDWPVSKMIEEAGLKDSFREANCDPIDAPGITWSPVIKVSDNKREEPQDRIDFIYYAGARVQPLISYTYHGSSNITAYPQHQNNDWPSDHSAVITNFGVSLP